MDVDIEHKQNYLREEILEKGYDPEDFLSFLIAQKGDEGADLEIWKFSELKNAVQEFVSRFNQLPSQTGSEQVQAQVQIQAPKNASYDSDPEPDHKEEKQVKPAPVQVSVMQEDHHEEAIEKKVVKIDYEDSLQCEKAEITEMSKYENILITLSFPEKHAGGLFSKSYITYLITTLPLGFTVRRRYSDFEWLKSILQSIYIGSTIPPIPKKNYGDRFNEFFISKRMRCLEKFLESLSLNPLIKNSQIFYDFLSIEKESDFANKKKDYQKIKIPSKLSEITTLDGTIKMKISKDTENLSENIKGYISFNESLLKKFSFSLKNLFLEMNQVSLRMKEISDISSQLYEVSEKSNDDVTVTDTHKMMSKLMNDWGESMKKQALLTEVEIKEYFKFIKNEFISFKDLIAKMEMNKWAFEKAEGRLCYKKEELFKQGNITRWELAPEDLKKYDRNEFLKNKDLAFSKMMNKETSHVFSLKQSYAYYSSQLISEYNRLRQLNGKRHKDHMVRVSQSHSDILADLHVMWADLLSCYTDIEDLG